MASKRPDHPRRGHVGYGLDRPGTSGFAAIAEDDPVLSLYERLTALPSNISRGLGEASYNMIQDYEDNLAVADDPNASTYDKMDAAARVLLGGTEVVAGGTLGRNLLRTADNSFELGALGSGPRRTITDEVFSSDLPEKVRRSLENELDRINLSNKYPAQYQESNLFPYLIRLRPDLVEELYTYLSKNRNNPATVTDGKGNLVVDNLQWHVDRIASENFGRFSNDPYLSDLGDEIAEVLRLRNYRDTREFPKSSTAPVNLPENTPFVTKPKINKNTSITPPERAFSPTIDTSANYYDHWLEGLIMKYLPNFPEAYALPHKARDVRNMNLSHKQQTEIAQLLFDRGMLDRDDASLWSLLTSKTGAKE